MSIFTTKTNDSKQTLEVQMREQAKKLGITYESLKKLAEGKACPKYGVKELLHARKVRGGEIAVFNISDKFRGEKISVGRKKKPAEVKDETGLVK